MHTLVEVRELGRWILPNVGIHLGFNPDTVRVLNGGFIRKSRADAIGPVIHYRPEPPDLAIRILALWDEDDAVEEEVQAWLTAGTGLAWVVDPYAQQAMVRGRGATCGRKPRCGTARACVLGERGRRSGAVYRQGDRRCSRRRRP